MISVSFSFCCFLFLTMLAFFYFSKQRINTSDNKFFSWMLVINIIGIFLDVAGFFSFEYLGVNNIINLVVAKVYLLYYLTQAFVFMLYVINISNKKINNYLKIISLIYILVCAFISSFPIYLKFENSVGFTYGPSVNVVYGLLFLFIFVMIVSLIRNVKKITLKRYIPLITFIIMMVITMIIQKVNPAITMLLLTNSVVTFLIYFTIENPDVKVINELNRNKAILEKNNENRSNFLFKMTQEVRKPINNIDHLANMIDTKGEYVKLDDVISAIKSNTRQISYIVNDVLDVTDIDIRKIKITNTKYNVKRLFEEINLFIKDKIPVNVTYNNSLSSEIPEFLYGDYIKLKQAIMSILINSCQNTKKGFIDLDVSTIIKYDMCRLIITIEDSGVGMNINKVNSILSLDKTLDEKDETRLEKMDVDLNITKKIINIIGGSLMISSEVDKGTEFIIVVDQKIVNENEKEIKTDFLKHKLRVLIVDDDLDLLNMEKNIFEKNDIQVIGTMYGMDCVNRIRLGEKYDYIILDDSTVKGSAKETLDELSEIENFNIPVIVMLEENKEIIKDNYLDIGFSDYILKDEIDTNIQKFIDKIK